MKTLIINHDEIKSLLPMAKCIELMAETLTAYSAGKVVLPLRPIMPLPDGKSLLAMMPAFHQPNEALGIKVLSLFPKNHGTNFDAHQGAVLLFSADNGFLQAVMDAAQITAIRTAAASGAATQVLSRQNAKTLAIFGSGVQAETHLEAMTTVREIERVKIWSRTTANAKAFANLSREKYSCEFIVCKTGEEAALESDIICTTTAATEPVLRGDWIAPGTHVNAIGASQPRYRELDAGAVAKSKLYVDSRLSAENEAGEYLLPLQSGEIDKNHLLGEVGEILLERIQGRTSESEITLFKSLGIAAEDVVSAQHIYREAMRQNIGQKVYIGGVKNR